MTIVYQIFVIKEKKEKTAMGKKNIEPKINQPVIRTNIAKPSIEGLCEENLTAGWTAIAGLAQSQGGHGCNCTCNYDGDEVE